MQHLEAEIINLTQYIWSATLGLEPTTADAPACPGAGAHTLDGLVTVSGAWQGTVVLQVSIEAAARAARIMFDLGDGVPSLVEMQDAVGELTNMTGGNLKALMDGPCYLSLPAVVEGHDYRIRVPGSETITRVAFDVDQHPFTVTLLASRAA